VIDCGLQNDKLVLQFLQRSGVEYLERLIVSHSHDDHIGGGKDGFTTRIFIAFVVSTLRGTLQVRASRGSWQAVDACETQVVFGLMSATVAILSMFAMRLLL
jgi:beta-lactamase superfamily II metal-dependent hydrolase